MYFAKFFILAFSFLSMIECAEARTVRGQASVIDGDTIVIHGLHIRFHGIDTPESSQWCLDENNAQYRCGRVAAFALDDAIGNHVVSCVGHNTDRYGRFIAVCSIGSFDLNDYMVRAGFGVAYRKYSSDYISAEQEARTAARGLWRGAFEMPWDWRHNN